MLTAGPTVQRHTDAAGDPFLPHHRHSSSGGWTRREEGRAAVPPAVLGLQVSALIDHIAHVDWSLLDSVPGDRGDSQQVLPCLAFS